MALGESNPTRLRALGTSPAALSKNEYGEVDNGGVIVVNDVDVVGDVDGVDHVDGVGGSTATPG